MHINYGMYLKTCFLAVLKRSGRLMERRVWFGGLFLRFISLLKNVAVYSVIEATVRFGDVIIGACLIRYVFEVYASYHYTTVSYQVNKR